MKVRLSILSLLLLLICSSCYDLDRQTIPDNTFSGIVFPSACVLSIHASFSSDITASLKFWAEVEKPDEYCCYATLRFRFDGVSCSAKKTQALLHADELPGTIVCHKYYRERDHSAEESLSGAFSFNSKMRRSMNPFGNRFKLGEGDKLSGIWIIRFEAEDGSLYLFKVTDVEIDTKS